MWPATIVQACTVHLIRNSFRYLPRQTWDGLKRDLRPIYTAPSVAAAEDALEHLNEQWGARYLALIRMWRSCWNEFIPFLDYPTEIRRVLRSTNAIESLNARYRRAIKARGHVPSEAAALKCLYLVTRSLDPKGTGQQRWAVRWKPALNALAVTFADRMHDLNRG
ncbi:transposase for the insertion element IS2606 (fragment) [Mycobacteroides abscessus subsp. abscessus]